MAANNTRMSGGSRKVMVWAGYQNKGMVFLNTKLQSTEYYLRLTKDRYPDILKKDAAVTVNISNVISRSMLKYEED